MTGMRTIEQILADLQAIIDGAVAEDGTERPLEDEEVQRYEALEGELQTVRRSIEFRTRHAAYTTPNRSIVPGGAANTVQRSQEEMAFEHYLRTGIPNGDLTPASGPIPMQYRAQAEGTGAAGGFLVPAGFIQKITERLKAFGGISGEAEHIDTGSGNPLPWPTNDDTANEGEIVAENATPAGGADLVLGQKTLGAYKYTSEGVGGAPLKVSFELAQDSTFNLEEFVQRKLSERIGRKQARDWAQGTGTGQPLGLLPGGTSSTIVASNAVGMTFPNIVSTTHAIDVAYREDGECVWVMNDAIFALLENLTDTAGRPLLAMSGDSIAGKPVMTLRGYRVVIDNMLPATYGVAAKTAIFGNVKRAYVIRDVKEITMIVFRELYAASGQIGYLAWARADGTVQDANAYTVVRGA
jgi:HK97 family phage major capsid protein